MTPRPWTSLGAHPCTREGVAGVNFCVWAPRASAASVVGDFNHWDGDRDPMSRDASTGAWRRFVPDAAVGARYKYELRGPDGARLEHRADPYAFGAQLRPETASVVEALPPPRALPQGRAAANHRRAPVSIYEVHLGSWRRGGPSGDAFLDWDALAQALPAYALDLGFTHLEFLPITEHPFDGSWGYQVTGMFAPTRRHGEIAGFGRLVEACQRAGLGVILDWVPGHFPRDGHGLARFDGAPLYEYADPREGAHVGWGTLIYDFRRPEVRDFLMASAQFWLEQWGLDGLRVDAVASMLYRDYSREPGEWLPNAHGGRENLEVVSLLRELSERVHGEHPGAVLIAEESTAWPGVSRPPSLDSLDGLGFDYKWNMGWMNDTLAYIARDPIHRQHHHDELTFSLVYAYDEDFVLPLSHDEVVHGKGSLLNKMPGDRWQRFANLRTYYAYMWTHPGKKLLFMGGEFGQEREWNHDAALDWWLLDDGHDGHEEHRGVQALVRDLNHLYRELPALHARDCEAEGFEWLAVDDRAHSILAYLRRDGQGRLAVVVCNFTPVPRPDYRLGLSPDAAACERWRVRLNSDEARYGGSGWVHDDGAQAHHGELRPEAHGAHGAHGRPQSLRLHLPPLATLILTPA